MRHSESFVGVPATLNALVHADYSPTYLEVYIAIRSLVSLSPLKDNFCFCFPGIETIGRKFGLAPAAVLEGITWLESNCYLYRLPRGRRPTTYTIVIERERFRRNWQVEGYERATELNEAWIEEQRTQARNMIKAQRVGATRSENPGAWI